jgi:hypothetical protein
LPRKSRRAPPKPNIKPKPVPLDERIPDPARREKVARDKTAAREKKCNELWDKIQKMTNNRRKRKGVGTQGLKYRYWDQICSEFNPNDPNSKDANGNTGEELWDSHEKQIDAQRKDLQNNIDEFEQNCEGDLPDQAKEQAKQDPPKKSEWRGDSPECTKYRQDRQTRYNERGNDPDALE